MTGEGPRQHWEPRYPLWATSILVSSLVAGVVAPRATSLLLSDLGSWGIGGVTVFGASGGYRLDPLGIAILVFGIVFASVPPGLLSLFLITLTDVPLRHHPLIGAVAFAVSAGFLVRSAPAAVFGFFYGFTSLGGSAAALAAHRHFHRTGSQGRNG